MGFLDFHIKLKSFRRRRHVGRRGSDTAKRAAWVMPISHGFHVAETRSSPDESTESDSIVVQREEVEDAELWFFGVFDHRVGGRVTKYMQFHLFGKKLKQSQMRRKSKETMRKAYLNARAKMREIYKEEDATEIGSVSAMVINGDKLVMANMGGYRAVVCRNGVARPLNRRRRWYCRLIPGALRMSKARVLACNSSNSGGAKSSELLVRSEGIDSGTEFVILASTGIWEVMKNQEAVNLIRHLEDPQEAAECLAREALIRMSRSNISCLVIRIDRRFLM